MYETGQFVGEYDVRKAAKLFSDYLKNENDPSVKFRLGIIYAFNHHYQNKKDVGLKYLEEIGELGDILNFNVTIVFEKYGEYENAIKYLKKTRVHCKNEDVDCFDLIDEEGVMLYFYPKLSLLYGYLGEVEKSNHYLEEALKANIGDAYIVKAYLSLANKDFEKAKSLFESQLNNNEVEATFGLGEIYSSKEYQGFDLSKAKEFYTIASELGHPDAEEKLFKISSSI